MKKRNKIIKSIIDRLIKGSRQGLSLIETMVGIIIFCIIFVFVFRAFAPTATASHNLLRGTTVAMNAGNWYLNELERSIRSLAKGESLNLSIGENDITNEFSEEKFSDIKLLRGFQAICSIKYGKDAEGKENQNSYNVNISFKWSNKENNKEKTHHFEMHRLIVKPIF